MILHFLLCAILVFLVDPFDLKHHRPAGIAAAGNIAVHGNHCSAMQGGMDIAPDAVPCFAAELTVQHSSIIILIDDKYLAVMIEIAGTDFLS